MINRSPFYRSTDPLKSPCVRNCCLNQDDVCVGCGRSLEEIRQWAGASLTERQQILDRAAERLQDDQIRNRF